MLQHYEYLDQARLTKEAQAAIEAEADRNTDLHSYGTWDGLLNEPPQAKYWAELPYREGYLNGIVQYYDKLYRTRIDEPF